MNNWNGLMLIVCISLAFNVFSLVMLMFSKGSGKKTRGCPECAGEGYHMVTCERCDGRGRVAASWEVKP